MQKTIEFVVSVDVTVPDGKDVFYADLAKGIQMGINHMTDEGELTGQVNSHVVINQTAVMHPEAGIPYAQDVAVTAAFFNEGARHCSSDKLHEACELAGYGHVEFMINMTCHAAFAVKFADACAAVFDQNYPGVFAYEVSEPFGTWYAKEVIAREGDEPSRLEAEQWLADTTVAFFAKGASESELTQLNALKSAHFQS